MKGRKCLKRAMPTQYSNSQNEQNISVINFERVEFAP